MRRECVLKNRGWGGGGAAGGREVVKGGVIRLEAFHF